MKDYSFLIGRNFGNRTVIGLSKKKYFVVCKCRCGDVSDRQASVLLKGIATSCRDCLADDKRENMIGKKLGKLVVIGQYSKRVEGEKQCRLVCKCECGKIVDINSHSKTRANSCGCSRIIFKDRERHQAIFVSWKCMVQRCTNPKHENYKYYGGSGVYIYEPWKTFINFYNDLRDTWFAGATIDRYPISNGNYVPENVRWATQIQQRRNQSNIKLTEADVVEIRASNLTQRELSDNFGVLTNTINRIINNKRWKKL